MNSISKIEENILLPIRQFPYTFFIIFTLLCCLEIFVAGDTYCLRLKRAITGLALYHNSSFPYNAALSYFVVVVAYFANKLHRGIGTTIAAIALAIVTIISIIQVFLFSNFGMIINTFAFQLLYETNPKESSEFMEVYFLQWANLKYILFLASVVGGIMLLKKAITMLMKKVITSYGGRTDKYRKIFKHLFTLYVALGIVVFIINSPSLSNKWTVNIDKTVKHRLFCIYPNYVFQTYNSILQFLDEREEPDLCAKAQQTIVATAMDTTIGNIVVVIGESHNRHHSSLYGYEKETNPLLGKLSNLFVFDDVITSYNATSPSFKNFLSTASVGGTSEWYEEPLFPTIFKQAGYNVVFNSNQFVLDYAMDFYSAQCCFFFNPKISSRMFSYMNSKLFDYDGELIEEYKKNRKTIERDSMNLVIHHLYGQHVDPKERYPKDFTYFTEMNYTERTELPDKEKEYVSVYDNATRYNDFVVSQIISLYKDKDAIVIYFADHGEEANDYRLHRGRGGDLSFAPCLHCQFDIPFIIYTSDIFINKHADVVRRIKESLSQPFMTDDLPHLLMDIANIETKWYNPTRSPINGKYNNRRIRKINVTKQAKGIDYDSICKQHGVWQIGF